LWEPGKARPEAKAAYFAAKRAAVAEQARTAVSSFAEADEATQNETVSEVSVTYQMLVDDVTNTAALGDFLSEQLSACVGEPSTPDALNWHFPGAVFFMLTIITTIGYGTFTPQTDAGLVMVVAAGSLVIPVFGLCLGPLGRWIASKVEHTAKVLLHLIGVQLASTSPTAAVTLLRARTCAALIVCLAAICASALIAGHLHIGVANGWTFVDLFYFSFVTLSSTGFGDFALGPEHDGHLELVKLLLQAIWIFFGMACFNTFMDAAADWANEVVEALTKRMYSLRAALGTVWPLARGHAHDTSTDATRKDTHGHAVTARAACDDDSDKGSRNLQTLCRSSSAGVETRLSDVEIRQDGRWRSTCQWHLQVGKPSTALKRRWRRSAPTTHRSRRTRSGC